MDASLGPRICMNTNILHTTARLILASPTILASIWTIALVVRRSSFLISTNLPGVYQVEARIWFTTTDVGHIGWIPYGNFVPSCPRITLLFGDKDMWARCMNNSQREYWSSINLGMFSPFSKPSQSRFLTLDSDRWAGMPNPRVFSFLIMLVNISDL